VHGGRRVTKQLGDLVSLNLFGKQNFVPPDCSSLFASSIIDLP